MGAKGGQRIKTNGLLFTIDGSDRKSMPLQPEIDPLKNHAAGEWVCMKGGTGTLFRPYPQTLVYERTSISGSETLVKDPNTIPTTEAFTFSKGDIIRGTKPIVLFDSGLQHYVTTNGSRGRLFGSYSNRGDASTYEIYALGNGTIYFYDNVAGGVGGTATSSSVVTEGNFASWTVSSNSYHFISSSCDIIVTVGEATGADRMKVPPARERIYTGRAGYEMTMLNAAPTTTGEYLTKDSNLCFAVEIADGAGGDSTQGLGLENLSNTYGWGEQLPDYQIVAMYPNTTCSAYYYDSGWVLGEEHRLDGTLDSPVTNRRSGDDGFGVDSGTESGNSSDMASGATMWKWESNNDVFISINDNSADEETLLGWQTPTTSNQTEPQDLTGNFSPKISNIKSHKRDRKKKLRSFGGGTGNFIRVPYSSDFNNTSFSFTCWVYVSGTTNTDEKIAALSRDTESAGGAVWQLRTSTTSNQLLYQTKNASTWQTYTMNSFFDGAGWYHIAVTHTQGSNPIVYRNGKVFSGSGTVTQNFDFATDDFFIGCRLNSGTPTDFWSGEIIKASYYNVILTPREIRENFKSNSRRFSRRFEN